MGDEEQQTPGGISRMSMWEMPNGDGARNRRDGQEGRPVSIIGEGFRGRNNRTPAHPDATSEQLAIEWPDPMMLTGSISYTYGNGGRWPNIFYHKGNEKTDEWKWKALPVKEWYAGISRILGRSFLSPSEMFGILDGDTKYRKWRGWIEK